MSVFVIVYFYGPFPCVEVVSNWILIQLYCGGTVHMYSIRIGTLQTAKFPTVVGEILSD